MKYETSVNIKKDIFDKLVYYEKITSLSKQEIIMKFLSHYIKKTKKCVFLTNATVSYQPRGCRYKKLTLHLDGKEVEFLRQIRVVTLLSVSFVLFLAMKFYGEKILIRAKSSKLTRMILKKFNRMDSYPEFSSFLNELFKSNRYFLQFQEYT